MSDDESLRERLARIEAAVSALQEESRALRSTLHELIRSALADHAAAIARLATAHDARQGMWWAVIGCGGALVLLAGAVAWIVEHNVQVIVKP